MPYSVEVYPPSRLLLTTDGGSHSNAYCVLSVCDGCVRPFCETVFPTNARKSSTRTPRFPLGKFCCIRTPRRAGRGTVIHSIIR
eukprot:14398472-Ditylum_brightwellii.AAC.1